MPKTKVTCDVDGCENDAVQQFVTDGGHGVAIDRCADHQIPAADVANSWVVKDSALSVYNETLRESTKKK